MCSVTFECVLRARDLPHTMSRKLVIEASRVLFDSIFVCRVLQVHVITQKHVRVRSSHTTQSVFSDR